MITRSPTASSPTAWPASVIVPAPSCPRIRPLVTAGMSPFEDVQAGAADRGDVHLHDRVSGVDDLRVGYVRVYGQRIDSLRLPELRRLAMSWRCSTARTAISCWNRYTGRA